MTADLQGILNNLDLAYRIFEHDDGTRMTKEEIRKLMEFCIKKGYNTTNEITMEDEKRALAK